MKYIHIDWKHHQKLQRINFLECATIYLAWFLEAHSVVKDGVQYPLRMLTQCFDIIAILFLDLVLYLYVFG